MLTSHWYLVTVMSVDFWPCHRAAELSNCFVLAVLMGSLGLAAEQEQLPWLILCGRWIVYPISYKQSTSIAALNLSMKPFMNRRKGKLVYLENPNVCYNFLCLIILGKVGSKHSSVNVFDKWGSGWGFLSLCHFSFVSFVPSVLVLCPLSLRIHKDPMLLPEC